MWKAALVLGLMIASTLPARASSSISCQALTAPLTAYSAGVREAVGSMKGLDFAPAIEQMDGTEREALLKLAEVQSEAVKAMQAYADQMEDTTYIIQRCAR